VSTILAIETSCDETSVAVVRDGTQVLSNTVSSQIESHAVFGGVVPEVASRLHLKMLKPVLNRSLLDSRITPAGIDAVAATHGPGLIGALLVGVSAAKALALAWGKPYVGVNHVEGHLFATFLERPDLEMPFVVLLVAGGHTRIVRVRGLGDYKVLGSTIDDAAGEAFDKVARFLGLGYPGGPLIDKLARDGDPQAIKFPRGLNNNSFDFSFSGLKTAVVNYVRSHPEASNADIAASFQEAVVDVLVTKTIAAAKATTATTVCLGGGVAANSRLREAMATATQAHGIDCLIPGREYCTDNAAMIAAVAEWRLKTDGPTSLDDAASPSLSLV
jgi:N6-L-threonylcarbamoyladenine synthase